jgi:hypothetical protein
VPSLPQLGVACRSPSQQQDTTLASLEHAVASVAGESVVDGESINGPSLPPSLSEEVTLLSVQAASTETVTKTKVGVRWSGRFTAGHQSNGDARARAPAA